MEFWTHWIHAFGRISQKYFIVSGVSFILFYFVLKQWLNARKIQERFPKSKDYFRDIGYSVLTMLLFAFNVTLTLWILRPYTQIYAHISDRPLWYYGLSLVLMFFLHDAYFYWAHRLMHHKVLFRHVHKVHHLSTNPSPWTSYAFHPFEAFVEASITPLIAFTIPAHTSAIMLFFLFSLIYNVYGHTGFELYPANFHKHWLGKWINTSVSHNDHHKKFHGNYGLYTLIWDRLFGTLRTDYDEDFEQVVKKKDKVRVASEAAV